MNSRIGRLVLISSSLVLALLILLERRSEVRSHLPGRGHDPVETEVSQVVTSRRVAGSARKDDAPAEHKSLWQALAAARHQVQPLSAREAAIPRNSGVHCFAQNPGQEFSARFLNGSVRIESTRGSNLATTLVLAGGEHTLPVIHGGRVEYRHANGVVDWFENRPEGLEHALIVSKRLPGQGDDLRIPLAFEGMEVRRGGENHIGTLSLADRASGRDFLRYGAVKAWDATGRELPARYEGDSGEIAMVVTDAGAVYPVTIDPLITSIEADLLPETTGDGAQSDRFGEVVALDGNTAFIGVPHDNSATGVRTGSVYVFVRTGNVWDHEVKLIEPVAKDGNGFGCAVALEGDTALVGGTDSGKVHVFVRTGTTWDPQGELAVGGLSLGSRFGCSLAISGDAALVGASHSTGAPGSVSGRVFAFSRSGGSWSLSSEVVADDTGPGDRFGTSIAMSGDRAVIGSHPPTADGRAHVFTFNGTSWERDAELLSSDGDLRYVYKLPVALSGDLAFVGADAFAFDGVAWIHEGKLPGSQWSSDDFGHAVALDGDTALIGAPGRDAPPFLGNSGAVHVFIREAAGWSEQTVLLAPDAGEGDSFGSALALDGDTALVGAYLDDTTAGKDAGSAHVFTRDGSSWSSQALLHAGDSAAQDQFGISVAISGATALIGAEFDDTAAGIDAGSAYVFAKKGKQWVRQAKLQPGDAAGDDQFGHAVALDGNTAVVGAVGRASSGISEEGAAYVFSRRGSAWNEDARLDPGDLANGDRFGQSVAVSKSTILVGAEMDDTPAGIDTGSVHVFFRGKAGWSRIAGLTAPDAAPDSRFGCAVAISGTSAVVGACQAKLDSKNNAGSAYVFSSRKNDWSFQSKLVAADTASFDLFGTSVAISKNTVVVGAPRDDTLDGGHDAGSAHVFSLVGNSWNPTARLFASDASSTDVFGFSVAVSSNTIIVGAPYVDTAAGSNSGCAYIFKQQAKVWSEQSTFVAHEAGKSGEFGASVALSGSSVIVGARRKDSPPSATGDSAVDQGSAQVFKLKSGR